MASPSPKIWRISPTRTLPLDRPRVMAIVNATPDSFSDGGAHHDPARAAAAAARFVEQGADVLDVGGESTRPGAGRIDADEQISRVAPVVEAIRLAGVEAPITVDTTLSAVARAALDAGADAINDVSAGTEDPGILALAAARGCGLILMHRLAPPDRDRFSDQYDAPPEYADVVDHVRGALAERARGAVEAGCDPGGVVLDPGLGFGKTVEQNAELVRGTARLLEAGYPVLGGASRKSFVGRLSMGGGDEAPPPAAERLGGSIAFSLAQLAGGVRLFRVHDVREQVHALRVAWALRPK